MAGPWERYKPAASGKPWERYGDTHAGSEDPAVMAEVEAEAAAAPGPGADTQAFQGARGAATPLGGESAGPLYRRLDPLELAGMQHRPPLSEDLMTPLLPVRGAFTQGAQLEYLAGQQPDAAVRRRMEIAAGVVKGAENVVGGGMEFMTSPVGAATLGMGALPAGAKAVASGAFAIDMARHAPDSWQKYWEARYREDAAGQAEAITEGLGNLAFAGLAGKHSFDSARAALGGAGNPAVALARALERSPMEAPQTRRPPAQTAEAPAPGPWDRYVAPAELDIARRIQDLRGAVEGEAAPAPSAPARPPRELPEVPGVPEPLEGQPYEAMTSAERSAGMAVDAPAQVAKAKPNFVPSKFEIRKPIKGPTGAEIVGYEWRSVMGEKWSEREGGYVEARVSDWSNSDKSQGTGRDIVHVFWVKHPDGKLTAEGVRSAQNILGMSEARLHTIAKREQGAQAYREQQERAEAEIWEKSAKQTPAEANADFRKRNYSAMRSFEENDALYREAVLFQKDGKFVRRLPSSAALMESYGWKPYVLTPELKSPTVEPSPAPVTITGSNERTGSEMPAERRKRPGLATQGDRPWDIIDEIEGQVGKLDPSLIREAAKEWRPVGAARSLFRKGGVSADKALAAVTYEGNNLGLKSDMGMDMLGEAINAAARARQDWRKRNTWERKELDQQGRQLEQFERKALAGERPKADRENVETVEVSQLLAGDEFKVQDHKFTVEKIEVDEDGRMLSLTVKDGDKFGIQTIGPERGFIHIDKATFKPVPRPSTEFLPPDDFDLAQPESVPEQAARLAAEEQTRAAKAARAKLEQEAAAPLRGTAGDLGQGDLLAGPQDLFAPPAPTLRGTSAVGDPITAMPPLPPGVPGAVHGAGRMPVAMERIVPGTADMPTVMAALENVMRAAGNMAPIRSGRFYQKARGIYKPDADIVRLDSIDNVPTGAHEVAHGVSDVVFGSTQSLPLIRAVQSRPAIAELRALGRELYGNRRPVAGYTAEGFSELVRLWLTTEDAARRAPNATAWLENTLLRAHPELARAMQQARDVIDIWRGQGAMGRAKAQMKEPPGHLERLKDAADQLLSKSAQVEEFEPLRLLSEGYQQTSGRRLPVERDPFLLASAKRGSAGAVMETMVERGMVDIWGNIRGPGLKEALTRVPANQAGDFAIYLWARRAMERWGKNQNPGMAREDAAYLRAKLESPAFIEAARKWDQWWDGLLQYVRDASPAMNGPMVDAIRNASTAYAPLARVLDPTKVKGATAGRAGGGLYRMRGSGLPIRNIYQQSLLVAEKMINRAHRDMVLESVFRLAQEPGMGWLVEEVPRTRAMESVNIEKLRRQLDDLGVDTSMVGADEILKFATHLDKPTGSDPIMVRQTPTGPRWYQVPARVFDLLEGLAPARLGPVADLLWGTTNRAFKLGTTGLRASFSLVTNPLRDFQSYMLQSLAGNPVSRVRSYFGSLGDILKAGLLGKESPEWKAFQQLGIGSGMFLGGDIQHARREARSLFRGRVYRKIASPVESLREILSFTEAAPRLAEMSMVGRELGWVPGRPLTPEQAIAMTIAAKRITTDFSAAGSVGKIWNQYMPFYNAAVQGTRAALRAFKRDQGIKEVPHRTAWTVLKGLSLLTIPALWNWWQNKDKDWYQQLPWRERYLYTNVEGPGGEIVQVPRPPEWGNAFMVLPEMLVDSWYRQDPESAKRGLAHIFTQQNPVGLPALAETARQQWENEVSFFNRPIVPRNQIDLPPGEQRAYYTSKLAAALGDAFPDKVSPRRVDAAVRSLFGGVGGDVMDAPGELMKLLGLQEDPNARGAELADVPVAGRLFRRGGEFSGNNQVLADFWDDYLRTQAQARAERMHALEGTAGPVTMNDAERTYGRVLAAYHEVIKAELDIAARTADADARRKLYQHAANTAKLALAARPKGGGAR